MAFFYIYETVEFPIQLSDPDALQNQEKVIVSLKQGATEANFENPSLNEDTGLITLRMEQDDTAKFKPGKVDVQVNIYYKDKERDVTTKGSIKALDNIYKKVIT